MTHAYPAFVPIGRRQFFVRVSRAATAMVLAQGAIGCAFHLRQAGEFTFKRIAFEGFSHTSLLQPELRRQLPAAVEVVAAPAQAQVIFRSLSEARTKRAVSMTATGLTRAYELRLYVSFELHTPAGEVLLAPTHFLLTRPLSTTESAVLAKMREEEEIYAEMTRDIGLQIMRRLEAIRMPPSASAEGK